MGMCVVGVSYGDWCHMPHATYHHMPCVAGTLCSICKWRIVPQHNRTEANRSKQTEITEDNNKSAAMQLLRKKQWLLPPLTALAALILLLAAHTYHPPLRSLLEFSWTLAVDTGRLVAMPPTRICAPYPPSHVGVVAPPRLWLGLVVLPDCVRDFFLLLAWPTVNSRQPTGGSYYFWTHAGGITTDHSHHHHHHPLSKPTDPPTAHKGWRTFGMAAHFSFLLACNFLCALCLLLLAAASVRFPLFLLTMWCATTPIPYFQPPTSQRRTVCAGRRKPLCWPISACRQAICHFRCYLHQDVGVYI